MWVEFLLSIMAIGMIALAAYFIGYDNGRKDASRKAKEEYEKAHTKWIIERCDLISEIIELKDDSKHEHYLTD